MVGSVNFAILGKQDVAADLGKKGTSTDITLYDRKESGMIMTYVTPSGFPDKIQPLLAAINLAEHVIFYVDKLDKFTGEQIIALDMLKKKSGILSYTFDVDEALLGSMVRGTVVEEYAKAEQDVIRHEADKLCQGMHHVKELDGDDGSQRGDSPIVVVDHSFDVKGVGTVVLGKMVSGMIRQYDTLRLFPGGSEILVKSIQMHDEPVPEAAVPARVGLAVKGARFDEINRGDMIGTDDGTILVGTEIEINFQKSVFYKDVIAANQGCLVNIGLQTRAAKVASVGDAEGQSSPLVALRLVFEKPVAYRLDDIAVILKPESATTRIIGSGVVTKHVAD